MCFCLLFSYLQYLFYTCFYLGCNFCQLQLAVRSTTSIADGAKRPRSDNTSRSTSEIKRPRKECSNLSATDAIETTSLTDTTKRPRSDQSASSETTVGGTASTGGTELTGGPSSTGTGNTGGKAMGSLQSADNICAIYEGKEI